MSWLKVFKSKTVWAGIGTAALGSGELLQQYAPTILSFVPATTPIGAGITIALGVMTVYSRIKAQQPLGPVIDTTIKQTVEAVHNLQGNDVPTPTTIAAVKSEVKAIQKQ